MIDQRFEKATSEWVKLSVSEDELKTYLITINEQDPLYTDKAFAKQVGYQDIPLPPAYPALFWQSFSLVWLEDQPNIILTTQDFHYNKPLIINQIYHGQITLKKLLTRKDSQLAIHELAIYHQAHIIATLETTLFLTRGEPS